ncbi:MAG TPA: MaoC family dehydratase [Steroidobacteraceae bacterium]|jgi:acyl dehydratase|nr:MaoC family dehydratase [Steroidobacteraceae bacterium]
MENSPDPIANGTQRPLFYLDDLQVGQRFTTGSQAMTATQIKEFAAQFDPQPFHLSEEAAQHSLFGALAASGWHTAAVTMRLLVTTGPRLAGGVVGASGEIKWPLPTRPGDTLHVESEVLAVRPSRSRPERGIVTIRSATHNQRGEVVQLMTANLVVARRT